MNTKLLIFKDILLLTASPNLSLHQNCKIRFLLEGTNTLFIPEGMLFKLFYEAQGETGSQFVVLSPRIPSSRKSFPQPRFVQRKCARTQRLMSARSSFTTMKVLTLFILLGSHSYYLQTGTD